MLKLEAALRVTRNGGGLLFGNRAQMKSSVYNVRLN